MSNFQNFIDYGVEQNEGTSKHHAFAWSVGRRGSPFNLILREKVGLCN